MQGVDIRTAGKVPSEAFYREYSRCFWTGGAVPPGAMRRVRKHDKEKEIKLGWDTT